MTIQGLRHGCQYFGYILWFAEGKSWQLAAFIGVSASSRQQKLAQKSCARTPTVRPRAHALSRTLTPSNASGQSLVTSCAIFSKAPIYASHAALSCTTDSVHSSSRPGVMNTPLFMA